MYRKILIANRGEIACRLARTIRSMGIAVAGVHSSADASSLQVRSVDESVWIGGAAARDSYLRIDRIIEAAQRVGADAIHPGFGFLAENPDLALACTQAGIAFIGPDADTLHLFGSKAAAKTRAGALGIPVADGLQTPSDDADQLVGQLSGMALPLILKAVAGGGGKGMRVVREREALRPAIDAAIREGRSAFGDGRLIAERYLEAPRHVEVQILGDGQGGVIHLWDRECTLQRRHQKVIEEAPVSSLPLAQREQLWEWAVALGRSVHYLGLGTVEFAVTGEGAVFLEVNPRLQVEHPVTESITGLDLVECQIRAVHDRRLPLQQHEVPAPAGVAVQARLYAEDPAQRFLPCTGTLQHFEVPDTIRCDTGVSSGSVISADYDPMIAKLIAHGPDRSQALQQLAQALRHTHVLGLTHNRDFLCLLLEAPEVRDNRLSTEFIDGWLDTAFLQARDPACLAALAALWLEQQRLSLQHHGGGAWGDADKGGWRLQRADASVQGAHTPLLLENAGQSHALAFGPVDEDGSLQVWVDGKPCQVKTGEALASPTGQARPAPGDDHRDVQRRIATVGERSLPLVARIGADQIDADVAGRQYRPGLRPRHHHEAQDSAGAQGKVLAPMMGIVIAVHVTQGETVQAGQRLATMESMKMELPILAPLAGTVKWQGCSVQTKVERHQDLFLIEP